jgi:16S rRNA (guanine(966)-N(2))-methyltransferase RsmD
LRIIGGKYKGRKINPPGNLKARPTTDFAKESLFNILNNRLDFEGLNVLDLFAGTGSIGLEFASRGAQSVTLVEHEYSNVEFIRKMAEKIGIENIHVLRSDFFRFIERGKSRYDVIFADPPYDHPRFAEIADFVMASGLLANDGWFIMEHSGRYSYERAPGFVEERNYGSVHFSFFRSVAIQPAPETHRK